MKTKPTMAQIKKMNELGELYFKEYSVNNLGNHLVVGHEFLESFKKGKTYYSMFGYDSLAKTYKYDLVSLLAIENKNLSYYRTGEKDGVMFGAVFLMKKRDVLFDDMSNNPQYCNWAQDKPVVLFFLGIDDGHMLKRFKTEDDAIKYIKAFKTLDDVISDNISNDLENEFKKDGKFLIPEKDVNSFFDNYICYQN